MSHLARVRAGVLAVVVLGAGCARYQSPVLYPNAKLQTVGKAQAEADIAACRALADDYMTSGTSTAKEIGKDTAVGGLGGAAIGAVGGAVSGAGAGRGAAIGAATGATAGAVHGTARSVGPSPIYKGFVDRCLHDKGYQVIGWQ